MNIDEKHCEKLDTAISNKSENNIENKMNKKVKINKESSIYRKKIE